MLLLSVIIEYFGAEEIEQYYASLNPTIENYLRADEPGLKKLSVATVNKLAQTPKAIQVLRKYNQLIPLMTAALDTEDDESIQNVFDTFNEFVEIKKVLGPHLPQIIEKAIAISANADHSPNLREITMLFLELIAEKYARALVKKHGTPVIDKVVETGFQIAAEDPSMYEGSEVKPPDMALDLLYRYAQHVPNDKVWPIFQKYLQAYGTSQNEHQRAAATAILGFVSDSDALLDPIKENMGALTNYLIDRMKDSSFCVREAAGETVGRFAESCGMDFLDQHEKVFPCLLTVVRDLQASKEELTVQKAIFALNEFVSKFEYEMKLYLEESIKVLLVYIQGTYGRDIRYWALVALSNVITSAKKRISPYQNDLLTLFQ